MICIRHELSVSVVATSFFLKKNNSYPFVLASLVLRIVLPTESSYHVTTSESVSTQFASGVD